MFASQPHIICRPSNQIKCHTIRTRPRRNGGYGNNKSHHANTQRVELEYLHSSIITSRMVALATTHGRVVWENDARASSETYEPPANRHSKGRNFGQRAQGKQGCG